MDNFNFYNPTKILFGRGRIADLAGEIPPGSRVLVTYGGGSAERAGTLAEVRAALAGFAISEFGGIEPNPRFRTLMRAVEKVRAEGADFLLAVGGGSVIDGTKFIAAAAPFEGDPLTILTEQAPLKAALPLGVVLTLPATGSEMNYGSIITVEERQAKIGFYNDRVFPRFSVLDPTKTFTLPPRQIANGVVDSFVHVLEQYLTYPVRAEVHDRIAEGLMQALIQEGARTLAAPEDYDARANFMWAATLALNGLLRFGTPQDWASHRIGYELTMLHGLDHGQTLAVLVPAGMEVRREGKREKLLQYAERVWGIRQGSEEERIDGAIRATRDFFEGLGAKTRLRDYGLDASHVDALVEALVHHGNVALGERGDVTPEVSRRILLASL